MKAPEALPLTPAVVVWSMPESASARSCMLSSPDSDSMPGTAPAVSWLALPDWSPLGTLDAAVSVPVVEPAPPLSAGAAPVGDAVLSAGRGADGRSGMPGLPCAPPPGVVVDAESVLGAPPSVGMLLAALLLEPVSEEDGIAAALSPLMPELPEESWPSCRPARK